VNHLFTCTTATFQAQYAGHYELFPGFTVSAMRKPCLFHRVAVRVLLGWKWHDTAKAVTK